MARMSMHHAEAIDFAATTRPADILFDLGLRYCAGRDVEPDLVEAHKWFNLAAIRGNVEARIHRADLAREMSADQIATAQREARAWLTAH